jgi:multidrug efflux system membrane fusion protein
VSRRTLIILAFLLAAGVGVALWLLLGRAKKETPAPAPIPVVGARVRRGDMEIHLSGLGTVTPLNTVTVRSRVDGELVNVAFREGETVREGDLLVEIDPRPFLVQLHQAEGQLERDEATLKNARLDLDRYRAARDAVSRQQLDSQVALVTELEAAIKTDQANVENAKLQLTYSRITSPITGVIGLRLVDRGNIIHPGDQQGIAIVEEVQPITVVFTLPEDDLPRVLANPNKGAGLPVDALDRERKVKIASGKLLTLDNKVDPATGTVRVKALFENRDEALFPSQFVNARVRVGVARDQVIVPTASIQLGPRGTYVYVVENDTVEQRSVVAGPSDADETAIEKGLTGNEVVVVEGVDKLRAGTRVSARFAAQERGTP